jgi:hypothetical protein
MAEFYCPACRKHKAIELKSPVPRYRPYCISCSDTALKRSAAPKREVKEKVKRVYTEQMMTEFLQRYGDR